MFWLNVTVPCKCNIAWIWGKQWLKIYELKILDNRWFILDNLWKHQRVSAAWENTSWEPHLWFIRIYKVLFCRVVEQETGLGEGQNASKTDVGTSLLNMVGNAIKQVKNNEIKCFMFWIDQNSNSTVKHLIGYYCSPFLPTRSNN